MGTKISAMTPKTSADGTEIIPVSDSLASKSITTAVLKTYVVDAIEAIAAGTSVTGSDSVFILQGGVLKPADIDLIAQYAIDLIWARADISTAAAGADIIPIKDGGAAGVEKTITLTNLAAFIQTTIEAAILDLSSLSAAATLTDTDVLLVDQGSAVKTTALLISNYVLGKLQAYVAALTAVTVPADTDVYYVQQGGVNRKITWAIMKGVIGTVGYSGTTTTVDKVPQWNNTSKQLKDGLSVQTTSRASGTVADTSLMTEKAIRDHIGHVGRVFISAKQMSVPGTTPATAGLVTVSNNMAVPMMSFAGTTANNMADFEWLLPSDYDNTGTCYVKAHWVPSSGASAAEVVLVDLNAVALVPDYPFSAALVNLCSITDTVSADEILHTTAAVSFSIASEAGTLIHFQLERDYNYATGGSAMTAALQLVGIEIQYPTTKNSGAWA